MSVAEPDPTDPIGDWYHRLYGNVEEGWLSFFSVDRTTGETQVRWCRATDLAAAAEITRELNARGDVWNGVAVRTHRSAGRGGKDECGWITALWSDIDFVDPGHRGNNLLPPDEEAASDLVRAFPIKPTAVVHTGGGLQAWHLLDEPVAVADLGDLLEAYGATWAKVGADAGYHIDNVFDLARIMRTPGTVNRKLEGNDRPVRLIFSDWTRTYGTSEMRDRLEDPPEPYVHEPKSTVPYIGPDRPGDEWASRHDGHDVLRSEGFHSPTRDSYGNVHYRASHRTERDQTGATVYADDGHVTIWSETYCATHPDVKARHGYDPFGLFVAVNHGNDFAAAARELRGKGYGAPRDTPRASVERFQAPPAMVDPVTGEKATADDGPQPLDPQSDLPLFPLHVLPTWMRTEVLATADAIQAPVEIAAGVALVALSTAIAGKVDVDAINYRQPTNIYLSIVAASGIGKSPVAARLLGPLYDLEQQLAEEARHQIAEAVAEATAIEEQASAAKQLLKKDPSSRAGRDAMRDAEMARLEHEVPAVPRLIADDHTPEALAGLIATQAGTRIAVLSPEGATLFSSMTGQRYKSGDAPPEVPPVYLKSWGGEPMPVDRRGTGGSIYVKRPILTVGVLVQPFVVDRLAATPQIAAQGGLARFLWIVARDNVGRRDRKRRRHAAPQSAEYVATLTAIARRCLSWMQPGCYTATDEAADLLDDINDERERRMGFGGDLDAYREIEAKIVGYQWRLAALLAVAHDDPRDAGITAERAQQAADLADYFLAHGIAIHRRAGLDERGGSLRRVAAIVADFAGHELDIRKLQERTRGLFATAADAVPDLQVLEQLRWLTVTEGSLDSIGVRGQPNPVVLVDARVRANLSKEYGA